MDVRKFKKGKIIVEEGSGGKEFFIILSGKVKVYKTINAEQIELAVLNKDECFGELNFFLNSSRTATVEALEDTEVKVLDEESFMDNIRQDPYLGLMLLKKLSRHLDGCHKIIAKILGEKKSLEVMYGKKL